MPKASMIAACALLVTGTTTQLLASNPTVTVADMFIFNTITPVVGATVLTRRDNDVRIDIKTTGLTPWAAYSMWWAIFNNPQFCTAGLPPQRCGLGDLPAFGGDPRVDASLLWGGGSVASLDGELTLSAELRKNEPPLQVVMGNPQGLKNVEGADIHVALRFHPGALAGHVAELISDFNGGCPNGVGCANVQASAHESH